MVNLFNLRRNYDYGNPDQVYKQYIEENPDCTKEARSYHDLMRLHKLMTKEMEEAFWCANQSLQASHGGRMGCGDGDIVVEDFHDWSWKMRTKERRILEVIMAKVFKDAKKSILKLEENLKTKPS